MAYALTFVQPLPHHTLETLYLILARGIFLAHDHRRSVRGWRKSHRFFAFAFQKLHN